MPLLRPSGSDYTAVVKAAAQYVKPGTTAKQSKSGSGMMLAPPSLGAVARASYVGSKSSPASSVIQLFGPVASGPAPFVDVWLNKLAVVTTLAGGGASLEGTGADASFSIPQGVGALPDGNIIVADTYNQRICLVTPTGVVTTIAGSGAISALDGIGTAATFTYPYGLAGLPNGNIVVADTYSHRIRLITMPGRVVTTLAGSSSSFADGTGTGASFSIPWGVATFPNGNIVVADTYNNCIRLITMPGAVVTTIAGNSSRAFADGTGALASFNHPRGVAVLPNGNIVVSDTDNNRIRLITMPGGVVTTIAGQATAGFADGTGAAVQFNSPPHVAVLPNGNIVVADMNNNRIRLVTLAGVVTTLAGTAYEFADGIGVAASFRLPASVTVLPNGNIAVSDYQNQRIRLITPT